MDEFDIPISAAKTALTYIEDRAIGESIKLLQIKEKKSVLMICQLNCLFG